MALPPKAISGIPPPVLLQHLDHALAWQAFTLRLATFQFEWTAKAAEQNLVILATFDYDLGRALASQPASIMSPGCKFQPYILLRPL
jgi:hypothetical protein